jgi:hypothetical protein
MIKTKIIKYYRKSNYGVEREFIHPDNKTEATQIQFLTGKKTIDENVRLQILRLSNSTIDFEEVLAP